MLGLVLLIFTQFLDLCTTLYGRSHGMVEVGAVLRYLNGPEIVVVKLLACYLAILGYLLTRRTRLGFWLNLSYIGAACETSLFVYNNLRLI